jgi:Schlafen, AlbA_2
LPPKAPSLEFLAGLKQPFDRLEELLARLRLATKEGKHLEWKQHPPTGPAVTQRSKYRMVKAALAFANWEGGFIVFGVDPAGTWLGLDTRELAAIDPAAVSELVNGCIFPEIPDLNYIELEHDGKHFALLHVPPSPSAPHVTTKQLVEKDAKGQLRVLVEKHGLYCRQGAKSDLATPHQHHQLIGRQTERLREELLRRIREVSVPILGVAKSAAPATGGAITFARLTTDPSAPTIRLSREEGASGTFLHEELSDGLFEEINNVVDANRLLATNRDAFILGEAIYYRVYAERQHVLQPADQIALLARTALHDFYAPSMYWVLQLEPQAAAEVMRQAAEDMKEPQIRGLMRLVTLLGKEASDWLWAIMSKRWSTSSQAPSFYWTFREMREKSVADPRLSALRTSGRALIDLPGGEAATSEELLAQSAQLPAILSRACLAVFDGQKQFRQTARHLDVLAYGAELPLRASGVAKLLRSAS